jgi:hypothetical protein
MKHAAIGIRAHSGWAAAVAVAGDLASPEILDRRRISVVDQAAHGAAQPYHFARELSLNEAENHLALCAKRSRELAAKGLGDATETVRGSGYNVVGCAVLISSGRAASDLAATLASHAMIHAAEGEFFRRAFVDACGELGIPVAKRRERELLDGARLELRASPAMVKRQLTNIGRDLGPPWTQDQKNAALAAWLLLNGAAKLRR